MKLFEPKQRFRDAVGGQKLVRVTKLNQEQMKTDHPNLKLFSMLVTKSCQRLRMYVQDAALPASHLTKKDTFGVQLSLGSVSNVFAVLVLPK